MIEKHLPAISGWEETKAPQIQGHIELSRMMVMNEEFANAVMYHVNTQLCAEARRKKKNPTGKFRLLTQAEWFIQNGGAK
jgi:hypothetical protein